MRARHKTISYNVSSGEGGGRDSGSMMTDLFDWSLTLLCPHSKSLTCSDQQTNPQPL